MLIERISQAKCFHCCLLFANYQNKVERKFAFFSKRTGRFHGISSIFFDAMTEALLVRD